MLGMVFVSCGTAGSKKMVTEMDSVSYAYSSLQFAPNIAYLDTMENLNVDLIIQAIRDAVAGKSKMTPEDANAFLNDYFSVRLPARALKESEEFLAEIESREGVVKTESGLLYEIIEAGGDKPTNDADTVKVLYTGTLPDGTVFDSTANRNDEPATFPLNGVISAWTEGMKLVGKGGKIKLYAPASLAYGERGTQGIQPNQALVFEVELLDIMPAAPAE